MKNIVNFLSDLILRKGRSQSEIRKNTIHTDQTIEIIRSSVTWLTLQTRECGGDLGLNRQSVTLSISIDQWAKINTTKDDEVLIMMSRCDRQAGDAGKSRTRANLTPYLHPEVVTRSGGFFRNASINVGRGHPPTS